MLALVLALSMTCHDSPLHAAVREGEGSLSRDLDGDGRPDTLRLSSGSGSGSYSAHLEMTLTASPGTATVDYDQSFESFLGFVPVDGLSPAAVAAAGDAFFDRRCDAPDPSLARLLDGALTWIPGEPVMPESYAVLTTNAKVLLRAREDDASPAPRAAWLWYGGANHGRGQDSKEGAPFKTLAAEKRGRTLLGTAHGVVAHDTKSGRYAWIYVHPGGQKLRWPTIFGAKFDGDDAVIDVRLDRVDGSRGTVRVNLTTGKTRETWTGR